jgi:anaerobic selenocysteine-containing dehydrogenase
MNQEILRLRRREFLKACAAAAAGSLAPAVVFAGAKEAAAEETTPQAEKIPDQEAIRDVRAIIGTGWRGHTFPGAVAP